MEIQQELRRKLASIPGVTPSINPHRRSSADAAADQVNVQGLK